MKTAASSDAYIATSPPSVRLTSPPHSAADYRPAAPASGPPLALAQTRRHPQRDRPNPDLAEVTSHPIYFLLQLLPSQPPHLHHRVHVERTVDMGKQLAGGRSHSRRIIPGFVANFSLYPQRVNRQDDPSSIIGE